MLLKRNIINILIQHTKFEFKKIGITLLSLICFCCGCGTNGQYRTLKDVNNLKAEAKSNYDSNKKIFNELKLCFALKYIKVIEFKNNNNVAIEYQINDTSKWEKTEININVKEIKSPLNEEGISVEYLLNLKAKLSAINANRIWIIDDYDATKGFNFKEFEIKYLKTVDGHHFFYKVFDRPLDSIEPPHYNLLIQDNIGGVLDKDVIYYYK